jgi:signal transduction histidine kinase
MDVRVEIDERVKTLLQHEQALGLFHIAQEALNNVSKHSQATSVSVKLASTNGAVNLNVTDNGNGFEAGGTAGAERHGLRNIRDRARGMGARLSIDSKPGAGTQIAVELPTRKKGRSR